MKHPLLLATSALAIATAFGQTGNADGRVEPAETTTSTTQASETSKAPQKVSGVKFEMEVGGYFESHAAYGSNDGPELTTGALVSTQTDTEYDVKGIDTKRDAEIFFKPSITLDNGVRIGATVELEAATGGDQIDEAYLSVDGSFGRVLLGSENSARYLMQYAAPDVTFFGVNSGDVASYVPLSGRIGTFDDRVGTLGFGFNSGDTTALLEPSTFTHPSTGTVSDDYGSYNGMTFEEVSGLVAGANELGRILDTETFPYVDPEGAIAGHNLFRATLGSTYIENMANNDAERITYFTPRKYGVQFGASYARTEDEDTNAQADISDEQLANIADFGLNYVGAVGPMDLAVSGGYGVAFGDADDNPQVWNAGLSLGWKSWTVGGSFAEQNNSGNMNMDGTAFDAGLAYKPGRLGFSFTYFHGENVDNEYDPDATTSFQIRNNPDDGTILREVNLDLEGDGKHIGQNGVDETHTMYLIGLNYDLAKGVRLNAFGGYGLFEEETGDEGGEGDDADGFVVGTGVRISF